MTKGLKIFLILGDSRSGTTLLANNIIKKLDVLIIPETNFIKRLLSANQNVFSSKKNLLNFLYEESKFYDLKIEENELLNNFRNISSIKMIIEDILKIYYIKNNGTNEYIGIKKGALLYNLDQIMNLFPEIKIFNLIRDGRGVYHSKKNSIYSQTGQPFLTNPYHAAKIWNENINMMSESKKKYNTIEFIYEEMIQNLDIALNKICKILKLEINRENTPNNKKGYYLSDIYNKNLHSNINLPPDIKNASKWEVGLSPREIFCFEIFAKRNLLKFNYQLMNENKNLINYTYVCICLIKFMFKKLKVSFFS